MKLVLCVDVQRHEGKPLYTVKICDVDAPVNFHSYDCLFFKQGEDLEDLVDEADKQMYHISQDFSKNQLKINFNENSSISS